ncbi:MAG: outer membrane lipoprotein-sorting protein, partial [Pseudomonadota bacterium]
GKLAGLGIAGLVLFSVANDAASAGEPPAMDGLTIARAILDREESAATQRIIRMTLTTHKGRTNERQAIVQKIIDAQWRATRITFLSPKKYRAMAFLSHDYRDTASSDNRWMYLPAAKRVRSIPSARRGNAFFGTDFSYEDIQSELKFREEDWQFEFAGNTDVGGEMRLRLQGKARDKRVARELGYSSFEALIDPQSWMPRRIDFIDVRGRALKRIDVIAVKQVDGVWTPVEIIAVNHQSGHRTRFVFEHTRHGLSFSRALFEPRDLGRRLADSHLAGASTATAGQGVE